MREITISLTLVKQIVPTLEESPRSEAKREGWEGWISWLSLELNFHETGLR